MMPFPRRKRNRFGSVAKRTEYNGVTYDSKAEAEWARVLDGEIRLEWIHGWLRQVTVSLGPDFKTRVDFLVFTAYGVCHFAEVKGVETARFKIVRKLWPKYGLTELHVVTKHGKRWKREVIPGKGAEAEVDCEQDRTGLDQS